MCAEDAKGMGGRNPKRSQPYSVAVSQERRGRTGKGKYVSLSLLGLSVSSVSCSATAKPD